MGEGFGVEEVWGLGFFGLGCKGLGLGVGGLGVWGYGSLKLGVGSLGFLGLGLGVWGLGVGGLGYLGLKLGIWSLGRKDLGLGVGSLGVFGLGVDCQRGGGYADNDGRRFEAHSPEKSLNLVLLVNALGEFFRNGWVRCLLGFGLDFVCPRAIINRLPRRGGRRYRIILKLVFNDMFPIIAHSVWLYSRIFY